MPPRLRSLPRVVTWAGLLLAWLGSSGCGLSALVAVSAVIATDDDGSRNSGGTPAPVVNGVFPSSGSHGGGETITIVGAFFTTDATISVGGVQATGVAMTTTGALTATVPFSSTVGQVDLMVTNPVGGSGVLSGGFTYTNTPTQVTVANLAGDVSQNVVITVRLTDVESDPTDLLLEVDPGDGSGFRAIPPSQILSGSLDGLVSSPTGFDQVITWDSQATFPNQNVANAVLRVTPTDTSDGQLGTAITTSLFSISNNTPVQVELTQPGDDAFNVALEFRVTDADSGDSVQVTGLTYQDLSRGTSGSLSLASGQGLGSVAFSAGGTTSTSVWNSLSNLGTGNNRLVTVTVTVSDGNTTASATSAPFFVNNGPLEDQTIVDAFVDVHGAAAGDVVGSSGGAADGLADLIAVDTGTDGPFGTEDTTAGGSVAIIRNRGARGSNGFESATVVRTLQDHNLQVGNTDGAPTPIGGATQPPNLNAPAGPVSPYPNYFLGRILHPSEAAILNVDNDARRELVLAHSPHAPDADIDLLSYANVALSNAGQDLAGSGGGHLRDHQLLLFVDHDAAGDLDFAGGVSRRLSQAPRNAANVAPIHTAGTGVGFDTGNSIPFIGYFVQDLLAAELDGSGGGGEDLLLLHGIADIQNAVVSDRRGAVTVLKRSGTALITSMAYLDPTAMGVIPVHMAVADITSAAHDGVAAGDGGGAFPVAPTTAVAAGLPDILIANAGDNSLTFYLQTAAATDANATLPTYHGARLPLNNLFQALSGSSAPAGDTRAVAIGDLNGDGANDFVVVGQLSRQLLVFIYDPQSAGPLSLNSNQSAGGDVNAGPYPQSSFPAGVLPFRLAQAISLPNVLGGRPVIEDLNGDGRQDIAVPIGSNNEVSVYVNSGNASARAGFGESRSTPLFGAGFADPATNALPTSAAPTTFTSEFIPFEAFAFDFDRDRRTDLAVACGLSFDFSVFYQGAAGTLDRFVPVPTSGSPFLLAQGDLTGDGVPELAASVPSNNSVVVFQRNSGSLSAAGTYSIGAVNNSAPHVVAPSLPFFVEISDVNNDSRNDLLITSQLVVQGKTAQATNVDQPLDQVGGWVLYPGQANALPLASAAVVRTSTFAPSGFAASAGDFLGNDGQADVVLGLVSSNGVNLYRGLGGGNFAGTADTGAGTAQIISISNGTSQVTDVVDLNADSYPDVLVTTADGTRGIEVYWGDPTGAVPPNAPAGTDFSTHRIDTSTIGPVVALLVADVGGPLHPVSNQPMLDIVVSGFTAQTGGILFQTAPGSGNPRLPGFVPPTFQQVTLLVGGEPSQIGVGDLDGNGSPDIAIPWGKDNVLAVYYRDADVDPTDTGTLSTLFQGPALFQTSNTPTGCAVLDVDGDGRNDVVVAARGANSLNVFFQR